MNVIRCHSADLLKRSIATCASVVIAVGCDAGSGPGTTTVHLGLSLRPAFDLYEVSTAIVALQSGDATVLLDTFALDGTQDSVIEVEVTLPSANPEYALTLSLLDSEQTLLFRSEPTPISLSAGSSVADIVIELVFVGPGSGADSVLIPNPPRVLFFDQSHELQAQALVAESAVPDVVFEWRSLSPEFLAVPDSTRGVVTASRSRGTGQVEARAAFTALTDTASILVRPTISSLDVVGGDQQTGQVGEPLPEPLRVRATGSDASPIDGLLVAFSTADGTLSPDSVLTDQQGEAETVWTLGPNAGAQTVSVSLPDAEGWEVQVTALAQDAAAPYLEFVVQPSGILVDRPWDPAVEVVARDGTGAIDTDFDGVVTLSIAPGTGNARGQLLGTFSSNATGGAVEFDNVVLGPAGGGYVLEATADGFDAATSNEFDVTWMDWQREDSNTQSALREVWGVDEDLVYAVGDEGVLLWRDGRTWVVQNADPLPDYFRALGGRSLTEVYAGGGPLPGTNGPAVLLAFDGSIWSEPTGWAPGDGSAVRGLWVGAASVVVGGNQSVTSPFTPGKIWRLEEGNWTLEYSGPDRTAIISIWGLHDSDVLAVGQGGQILRNIGSGWEQQVAPPVANLQSVWASHSGEDNDLYYAWAVGDGGSILRGVMELSQSGTTWTAVNSGVSENLSEVYGAGPADVFAVGRGGTLLHYDGVEWLPEPSGVNVTLAGVWVDAAGNVAYAVGENGTVLRGSRVVIQGRPLSPTHERQGWHRYSGTRVRKSL